MKIKGKLDSDFIEKLIVKELVRHRSYIQYNQSSPMFSFYFPIPSKDTYRNQ